MRSQIEGSQAMAQAVALCRPQVIPAYPITPQTHIVEALGRMTRTGELASCEFVTVESEFAAMSAAIGASAAGARAYTATASQGLLYMTEAVFNAAGMGLPIVMTVANRAIGAPINIWNDHSDAMSQRDCGWVQLYAEDNQDAVALHLMAFRLAETLSVPVMVCVDGFVLTHAFEPVDLPDQQQVDAFLPRLQPRQVLDPAEPVTIGAMVGPDAFTEVRYLADQRLRDALRVFPALAEELQQQTGQQASVVSGHGLDGARTVVVTLGSVVGTLLDTVDELTASEPGSASVGVLRLGMFRPFPAAEVRVALGAAERVVVLERAFAPGAGGVVTADVRAALTGLPITVSTVVAGLGGRPVTKAALTAMLERAEAGELSDLTFLDLRADVVEPELALQTSRER